MGGCLGRFREERWLLCFPSRFVFGPGRSRQEQSDRREPVPAEHESLTLKNVKARRVGSAARFGGHHLARFHIIPRPPARVRHGLPLLSSLAKLRAFTSPLDPEKTIDIRHNRAQVGSKVYPNVEMKDILVELTRRLTKRNGKSPIQPVSLDAAVASDSDPITVEALYPRCANFLKSNDIVIAETGTSSMGLAFALIPKGATFHNQTLWAQLDGQHQPPLAPP